MYAPNPDIPSMSGPHYHRGPPFGFGFVRRYFSNMCLALSSCFYFLCCCWILEDGVGRSGWEVGPRDPYPRPSQGPLGPDPPNIPITFSGPPGPPQIGSSNF
uniref:Uncharacterized protein n=1 Tax=Solanum lycopersicum TaxID=4081 RepID=A0A3Q7EFZ8_SOLLC|nr:uncharacterized protein LOC101265958 [Solanum lycopersicum]